MIRIYTKNRHISKIKKFLNENNYDFKIYTIKDKPHLEKFDLGVSYCYPRKITQPILSIPSKGFVNYHPAPLPKYKGPTELEEAIKNKETNWGVTVHYMDENYDTGPIIKIKNIDLHEPPVSQQELGPISHYFLFQLFKETIFDIYNKKMNEIL
jgi:methionyl-tRNA formyltransferase